MVDSSGKSWYLKTHHLNLKFKARDITSTRERYSGKVTIPGYVYRTQLEKTFYW